MYLNETINWCCFKEILKSSEVHKDWFTVWTVKDVCTGFLNTYVALNYQNDKDFYFLWASSINVFILSYSFYCPDGSKYKMKINPSQKISTSCNVRSSRTGGTVVIFIEIKTFRLDLNLIKALENRSFATANLFL